MRFLLDVNAGGPVAEWLRVNGHDIIEVASRNEKMPDPDVISWACDEQRIIVTTDVGFEELIWREGRTHFGLLRLENLPRYERLKLLEASLAAHQADLESGAVVIATKKKSRVRRPIKE